MDLALVLDDALFRIGQQGDDQFHGFHVGGEGSFLDDLFFLVGIRSDFVGQTAHVLADAFGHAGTKDGLGLHFQQLIFAGRGTGIDHKNFHGKTSLWLMPPGHDGWCVRAAMVCDDQIYLCFSAAACTAVMATVFTMSGTVQPRERSLTGLLRPWSTGPMATASAARCTAL